MRATRHFLRALIGMKYPTAKAYAARVGISSSVLSRIVHGQLVPSAQRARRMEQALDVAPGTLFPERRSGRHADRSRDAHA